VFTKIVWFCELDNPVLSAPATIRDTITSGEDILPPPKWCLTGGGTRSMSTQGVVVVASRSNKVKMRRKEN
jgi:hypothetical protein